MPDSPWYSSVWFRTLVVMLACAVVLGMAAGVYAWYYRDRVLPNTHVGIHDVGGLTRDQVAERMQTVIDDLEEQGIRLAINGASELISPENIGFDLNLTTVIEESFARGHTGTRVTQFRERITALWKSAELRAPVLYDAGALRSQIRDVAILMDAARRDVRLLVRGTTVELATDTAVGRVIDQSEAARLVGEKLAMLDPEPIRLALHDDPPRADPVRAQEAAEDARRMIARPVTLAYEDLRFSVTREQIAAWLVSAYEEDQLVADLDEEKVSVFVTTVADTVNIPPEPARITTQEGRVTGFTPPKIGRAVQEDRLVALILEVVRSRATAKPTGDVITIPLKATNVSLEGLDSGAGITELIGTATTPFTGSPKNRISNIKNGIKFLTGTIIPPGTEFSTLGTLGTIDNTTGYLPELVIKGDRTVPEFGGGLCQVSTTLFRSVLNAGLPVTARRNHSYRVSYYEKDGSGRTIGPGLDATIYEPDLDFRFLNDTPYPVLIIGYVIGDKATFELYGTKDGRTAAVDGPHTLTQTPAGEPVYLEDPTLPLGTKKQVETPHPGGSAVATYTITYSDGTVKTQEFKSWYRRWPAVYLVNTGMTPSPSLTPSPAATTTP